MPATDFPARTAAAVPAATAVRPPGSARAARAVLAARVALALVATLVCALLAATALLAARPVTACAGGTTQPRLVILVLAPYLTFDDLSPSATPALWRLAENGAIGAVNARTADNGQPRAVSGALTISAGRWASVEPGTPADAAHIDELQAAQAGSLSRPVLGALGSAIHGAGGRTGAARARQPVVQPVQQRAAELAAMDTTGLIDDSFSGDVRSMLRALESSGGPHLLVIDSPALAVASESTSLGVQQARTAHTAAVRELDNTIAAVQSEVPGNATLMVVTPATSKSWYEDPNLGVAIVSGPGFSGELTSASTHRTGLVTTLDVAPTILSALGIGRPTTMVGTAMTSRPSSTPLAEKFATLSSQDVATGILDQLREAWFTRAFVALSLLAVAIALLALMRAGHVDGTRSSTTLALAEMLVLLVATVPPAAWLMFLGSWHPHSLATALGSFGAAVAVLMAGLLGVRWYASRRRGGNNPLVGAMAAAITISTVTALVILADQWLGDPLRTGLFSYSVRSGWRFYGVGNEGAALVVGASLIAVGLAVDALRDTRWNTLAKRGGVPAIGAVVLITTAAPFAGANAGVAVWGVIAYAVAWVSLNRLRMSLKAVAITAALVAVVVAAFVAIDMATAAGGSTHLARFAGEVLGGDMASTTELVRRKLANNLGYFVATIYTLLFLGLGAVFALLTPKSASQLRIALDPLPAVRGALFGAFIGGLFALATEDSSSVMPALLWFAALMPALVVALGNASAGGHLANARAIDTRGAKIADSPLDPHAT